MKPTLEAISRRRGAAYRTPVLFVAIILLLAAAIGFLPVLTGNNTIPSSTSSSSSSFSFSSSSSSVGAESGPVRSFQNSSQLQNFMAANAKSAQEYDQYGGAGLIGGPMMFVGGITTTVTMAASATAEQSAGSSASS